MVGKMITTKKNKGALKPYPCQVTRSLAYTSGFQMASRENIKQPRQDIMLKNRMASRVNIKPPCQGILLKDRISELPPEILVDILSQLETKEAGRTSILSRKWRYMWTQISNLNFDASEVLDEIKLETKCFKVERPVYINHVNQVINRHQGQSIDQFVAVFDLDKSSGSDIDNWVSFAIRKRVRKLKLDLTSLRRNLQINRYRFPDSVEVSSCSSLTSLHLSEVEITGDMLQRFLHNCLNLESLYVQGTTNVRSLNVNGPSLKLKWLELSNCTRIECLNVSAPNLVSFKYKGPKIEMPLKDVPKLFEASVSGFYGRYLNQRLSELSNCLSQLEKLTLEASTFRKYMIEDARFPVFPKVKHLTLTINTLCLDGILDCPSMISACPSLYKFSWETWCKFYDAELGPFKAGAYPPHGIKVVEFVGFRCEPFEIDLAKYLIKTAVMLEKISFDTVSPLYKGRRLLEFRHPENRISAKECAREIGRMLPPSVQLVIEG